MAVAERGLAPGDARQAGSEEVRAREDDAVRRPGSGGGASPFDVTLRRLWARIHYDASGSRRRSLLVTSSISGEGTTTAVTHLARIIAEGGRVRVLLVDANVRAPGVQRALGLPQARGLSDLLQQGIPLEEAIQPTTVPGLHVVGRGESPANASQVYREDGMKRLLEEAMRRYDLVLVDGPPVLECPEAVLLSRLVDGTILLVEANRTDRADAARAKQEIVGVGGVILGALLNRRVEFIPRFLSSRLFGRG